MSGKRIYFASDFHLGYSKNENTRSREDKVIRWLSYIRNDVKELFLLGDVFDFWFEYKHSIPKGFTRLLGKLAEFSDNGIKIHFFIGNHDIWLKDYFQNELNFQVYFKPVEVMILNKRFFLAHGDALGPGDFAGKFINKLFKTPLLQKFYSWLHPDIGIPVAKFLSSKSRDQHYFLPAHFLGKDKEPLVLFANKILEKKQFDYFIFGHRHIVLDIVLNETSRFIILGDWITHFSYGIYDGNEFNLHYFKD